MKTNFLSKLKSNTVVDVIGDYDGGGSGSDEIFRVYHSNTPANRLLTVLRDGKTGIGLATPLAKMHIQLAVPAGAAAPSATDALMVDGDSYCNMNLRTTEGGTESISSIVFSDGTRGRGQIHYVHRIGSADVDYFRVYIGGGYRGRWSTAGLLIGDNIAPDSLLHVWKENAGTVTAIAGTLLTLENNEDCLISFLSGGLSSPISGFKFGTNGDNNEAEFIYDWDDESFLVRTLGDYLKLKFEKGTIGNVSHLSTISHNEATTQPQHKLSLTIGSGYTLAGRIGFEFENSGGLGTVTESYAFKFGSDFIEDITLQDDEDQEIPIMTPAGKRWIKVYEESV